MVLSFCLVLSPSIRSPGSAEPQRELKGECPGCGRDAQAGAKVWLQVNCCPSEHSTFPRDSLNSGAFPTQHPLAWADHEVWLAILPQLWTLPQPCCRGLPGIRALCQGRCKDRRVPVSLGAQTVLVPGSCAASSPRLPWEEEVLVKQFVLSPGLCGGSMLSTGEWETGNYRVGSISLTVLSRQIREFPNQGAPDVQHDTELEGFSPEPGDSLLSGNLSKSWEEGQSPLNSGPGSFNSNSSSDPPAAAGSEPDPPQSDPLPAAVLVPWKSKGQEWVEHPDRVLIQQHHANEM